MNIGLLILRLAIGGTIAAHGMQKLLPQSRGGFGIDGTTDFVKSLGFRPARGHAWLLALAELVGGLALTAGFLTPLASAVVIGVMVAAIGAVHLGKGFFAQNGGYELPMLLGAGAWALAVTGPGEWSLDWAFDWHVTSDAWAAAALLIGIGSGLFATAAREVRFPKVSGRHPAHA
jgi:putative oxidoreductase